MNKEELKLTIKYLETCPPEKFNMRYFVKRSKNSTTACCIAGTVCELNALGDEFEYVTLLGDDITRFGFAEYLKDGTHIVDAASKILDITSNQATWLFYGEFSSKSVNNITKDEAIHAMKYLMENEDEDDLQILRFQEN